jgi:hypothetical protein
VAVGNVGVASEKGKYCTLSLRRACQDSYAVAKTGVLGRIRLLGYKPGATVNTNSSALYRHQVGEGG